MIFEQILDYRHQMPSAVGDEYQVNRLVRCSHDTQAERNMDHCRLHPENRLEHGLLIILMFILKLQQFLTFHLCLFSKINDLIGFIWYSSVFERLNS